MDRESLIKLTPQLLRVIQPTPVALAIIYLLYKRVTEDKVLIPRSIGNRKDPKQSNWWQTYWVDPTERFIHGTDYQLKRFRHRFRISKPSLIKLVDYCHQWMPDIGKPDCIGREGAPIELLIMGSLAILGRVASFEVLEDVTFISSSTHRRFFEKFCETCSQKLFNLYVIPPQNAEQLLEASLPFANCGLPGAFCSIDGVRVRMWNCAYNLKHNNVGKEGYPCRVFQASVGSNGKFYSCTKGFNGNQNDMAVTNEDRFIDKIRTDDLFTGFKWKYVDRNRQIHEEQGAWALVDGGYPNLKVLQCPPGLPKSEEEFLFRRVIESLRKDIERAFGVLKQRFLMLKTGFTTQSFQVMDDIFLTCVALHNFVLTEEHTFVIDSVDLVEELGEKFTFRIKADKEQLARDINLDDDGKKKRKTIKNNKAAQKDDDFLSLRKTIVNHFWMKYNDKACQWPVRKRVKFNYGDAQLT
jgi:hypothetical protein